jgi:hypothetical protein
MAESHQEEFREVVSLEHHFSAPIALIIELTCPPSPQDRSYDIRIL